MLALNSTPCKGSQNAETPLEEHVLGEKPLECDSCLQYVNIAMTILKPYPGKDSEFNQLVVHQNAYKLCENMNLEEHYLFVRRLEALAAAISLCYQQRIVKERVPNPKQAVASQSFQEAVQAQKDAQRPKKERVLLDAREKAVKALTDIGLPLEIAEKQVDAQMIKQGRAVRPS